MLSHMPMMNCQYPPSRAKSSGDGDFFFYVEGLPPYYTWSMLKDLTRQAAPYPGWTEMASNPQGMQKGRGWIKIKRSKDAFNLYVFYHPPPIAPRKMSPTYVYTPNQRPVNSTRGLVKTESRGIFISQLDYAIDQRQLEEYLHKIGFLDSCEIRRDPASGRSRGIATVKFTTTEAAARAVHMLNGQKLMSKTVNVRFDTEKEAVTPTASSKNHRDGLIIANGSK
ncbi:hypothetical protein E4T42_05426 [Aureobasidium subglaciale]|nr:hypothetical protein E4T42_05426 [Aureobasidium subglaciale]